MRTINKIITPVSGKRGAPMGRNNVGVRPSNNWHKLGQTIKVFDCFVPIDIGGYDKGGVYWGIDIYGTKPLRVAYTKDLSYIKFYRALERKEV